MPWCRPADVVRHDDDDPYLVVAADKGTATFSDIANGIAAEYGFWLGDAFASGGSAGYDHKGLGITARGAWESVKRHFRALGTDVQQEDFTVVGIGDMSGDVFGNGMLLSPHIKLVGAFDHRHVFLDPDPDPAASFAERERLFRLPGSSWEDYDPALISPGGGVFPRTAKSIELSAEARAVLGVEDASLTPNEVIRAVLRAPVDLLWNGGIGTYVKARDERHAEVGDKANDAVRVDAEELRCRVVGEGGNLGFTQRARIAYALGGGRIFMDAIDNSAGVDCSDHEVNIKILLDAIVADGDLTEKQRNALLAEMADDVAALVLRDNYEQAQAISRSAALAGSMVEVHERYIRSLEQSGQLNRELEFLPSDEELAERRAAGGGLATPEFAILLSYTKIALVGGAPRLGPAGRSGVRGGAGALLPAPCCASASGAACARHPLRREIIVTRVANDVVNHAGTTFVYRLGDETGAAPADTIRAYTAAREVFGLRDLWAEIEALDGQVDTGTQVEMMLRGTRAAGARDAVAPPQPAAAVGRRRDDRALRAGCRDARRGAAAGCSGPQSSRRRARSAGSSPRRACLRARGARRQARASGRGARHRRDRGRDGARRRLGGRGVLRARRPARAALAARPHRRPAQGDPLGRDGPRRPPRRRLRRTGGARRRGRPRRLGRPAGPAAAGCLDHREHERGRALRPADRRHPHGGRARHRPAVRRSAGDPQPDPLEQRR